MRLAGLDEAEARERLPLICEVFMTESRDPVELRLARRIYETARMSGFFGAVRDSMPDPGGAASSRNTAATRASRNSIT